MNKLEKWHNANRCRNYVLKAGVGYECRFHLIIWNKKEGEKITGVPGEGFGASIDEAFVMALNNLDKNTQERHESYKGVSWYIPVNIQNYIEGKEYK